MKNLKYSAIYLAAFVVIMGVVSCGKKWKKPASVSYQFRLNDNSSSGLVNFTDAHIRISGMKFYGDRKQGQKHVEMSQSFDPALHVPLSLIPTSTDIEFDIPQGTYHKIEMEMDLHGEMGAGAALVLQGYYIKDNVSVPVKFEYYSARTIKMNARNSSGDPEIVLSEDHSASATVYFDPSLWFREVPQAAFDKAELSSSWGDSIMMITPDQNSEIYKMVIDRLGYGNEVVF